MDMLNKLLLESLPPGVIVVLGVLLIRQQINGLSKDVRDIKKKCDERLKWCIDHFTKE